MKTKVKIDESSISECSQRLVEVDYIKIIIWKKGNCTKTDSGTWA